MTKPLVEGVGGYMVLLPRPRDNGPDTRDVKGWGATTEGPGSEKAQPLLIKRPSFGV